MHACFYSKHGRSLTKMGIGFFPRIPPAISLSLSLYCLHVSDLLFSVSVCQEAKLKETYVFSLPAIVFRLASFSA